MEIDPLDDFEISFQREFDWKSTNWNGGGVQWLSDWGMQFQEKQLLYCANFSLIGKTVSLLFCSNVSVKAETIARQSLNIKKTGKDIWTATHTLVDFYLRQRQTPKETLSESGLYFSSGRISLQDLLAPDYLDRSIQIVPFAIQPDVNLPFIELPEGVSWESLNAPIVGVFQSYFPQGIELLTMDRNWWRFSGVHAAIQVQRHLELVSSRCAEVVTASQAKAVDSAMEPAKGATGAATEATNAATATAQAHSPYAAIEQAEIAQEAAQRAKNIALAAEKEWVLAEELAKAKAIIADTEKQKAIDATTKAILATEPPCLGQPGMQTKPREYIIKEWNKERTLSAAEAESQSNRAASAAEEAKIAAAAALGRKQAAVVAKEQAQIAEKAAMDAHFYATVFTASPVFYAEGPVVTSPQPFPLSIFEFSLGFTKGLPTGVYESGKGLVLFFADFVKHPIHTSGQIVDSVAALIELVRADEWGIIAQSLSPAMYQLVTQWDTLPWDQRGELAGYAVGKHGGDILAPGAIAKIASKSVKSAQELAAICKNLGIAEEAFLLEAAGGIGNSAKVAEVIEMGQETALLAEKLGVTADEIAQLEKAGKLEPTVAKSYKHLTSAMQESFELFNRAQEALKQYAKTPMLESRVRALIHETGIPTFPRPKGIPEDFLVMVTEKGAGILYRHPKHNHTSIRVMPGKPHSPFPYQQNPYIIQTQNGKVLDKFGNVVPKDSLEAHITLTDFIYLGD